MVSLSLRLSLFFRFGSYGKWFGFAALGVAVFLSGCEFDDFHLKFKGNANKCPKDT